MCSNTKFFCANSICQLGKKKLVGKAQAISHRGYTFNSQKKILFQKRKCEVLKN